MRTALLTACIAGVYAAAFESAPLPSQAPDAVQFEVASVKINPSEGTSTLSLPPVGRVTFVDAPLRRIIAMAYGIELTAERYALLGGDSRVLSTRFDVIGQPPERARPGENQLMLRRLLADRFKLRVHEEVRDVPVYKLTVAHAGRFGANFRAAEIDCDAFIASGGKPTDTNAPKDANGADRCFSTYGFNEGGPSTLRLKHTGRISGLIRIIQPSVDRRILDETGLRGNYDWLITFRYSYAKEDANAPLLFDALQEQLGLKLVPGVGKVSIVVIDSVAMPTPN